MDQSWLGWKRHPGRIVDEPQHATWERPVGPSGAVRLQSAKCKLAGIPQWPPRTALRSTQIHQLAVVLGVLRWQCDGKHGPPDRMDHVSPGPAFANCRLHVGGNLFRKRWA